MAEGAQRQSTVSKGIRKTGRQFELFQINLSTRMQNSRPRVHSPTLDHNLGLLLPMGTKTPTPIVRRGSFIIMIRLQNRLTQTG